MTTEFESGPSGGTMIFEAIPAIIREVAAVTKARKNQAQGFNFRGVDDIYNALHGLMGKHKVFSVPCVKSVTPGELPTKNGSMRHCAVVVEYRFFAADGSSFVATVPGEAADSGDKSTGKAMSYAHKIALIQVFSLETNEQQDPDYDSHEYVSNGAAAPASLPAAAPVPQLASPEQKLKIESMAKQAWGEDWNAKLLGWQKMPLADFSEPQADFVIKRLSEKPA